MEITKKLEIFYASAIEVANKQSSDVLSEYTKSLEKLLEEAKKKKKEEIEILSHTKESEIKREANKKISETVTELKRQLNLQQQEKKEALFKQVEQMLKEFLQTGDYQNYLVSKILAAKEFAQKEEFIIYLNASDIDKKLLLEEKTGCQLTISEIDFYGGIRAVIRSKNILMDESFLTKLNQEREDYTF